MLDTMRSIPDNTSKPVQMKPEKFKIDSEGIFLIIVFALLLWTSYGALSGHKLSHESLTGYFAADPIQDSCWIDGIKDTGNYKYFAPWTMCGLKDINAWYAPPVFQLIALISSTSGLESHDALIFIVYLFAVISAIIAYFIIRDYNKNVAMLSMPLMAYLFFGKFYNAFLFGQWGYTISCLFMIASFWAITKINKEKSYILLALFITGIAYTHISELIYTVLFIIFFLAFKTATKEINEDLIKKIILAGIISFILSAYFILMLKLGGVSETTIGSFIDLSKPYHLEDFGFPGATIALFGIMLIPIIIGMALSLKQIKKMHTSFLIGYFMLLVGYLNYLGGTIGVRSIQNRYFWPIYISVFFGLTIYAIAKLIIKEWKPSYSAAISILLLVVLIVVNYEKPGSNSLMEKERLDGLKWFNEKTTPDAKIFFFYGDTYSQTSVLWLTKRVSDLVNTQDYIEALKENKIKRKYLARDVGGFLFHQTSFFTSEDYREKMPEKYSFMMERDICDYDYYVFDKTSYQQVLAQYNMVIASKLAENPNIKQAFTNNMMLILKNEKPGEDCIEEQQIS